LLSATEKKALLSNSPNASKFIKTFIGSDEFLYNDERYCLWIDDKDVDEAMSVPEIGQRIKEVERMRKDSPKKATQLLAKIPYKFGEIRYKAANSIIIPLTTSEHREYIPIGFLSDNFIVSNAASVICNAEPYSFAILSSKLHIVWIKAVCGSLESRIRYSSVLGYNTFPFPKINESQKQILGKYVFSIIEEREKHSEKTLAELYDPIDMPVGLREAHHQLDLAVERCYRSQPFESDEERLEYLFKLYEQMIAEERQRSGELFFEQPKTKKKRK
jgi:hypothetical protein